ncbi:CRP/FNR family transcriptional regulator [Desulfohalotomaculum tongense]|uniref:Crp/Fnr family transcriptional regulator n=1 Tax=Desulforadius tongensis TaxID=1216062 RepID=UPI00195B7069|nr:Crp/Fnr family transcriptional regulator [Desulforadius tongensis]MBM7855406.1 CRP/FNR family transcriptional regulator [Desulforadius tongensis]
MNDNVKYFKKCALFSELTGEQLAKIAKLVHDRSYKKGSFVFLEDDPGTALFILKQGLVKLTKRSADGREHILHFVHPGEVFAEVVLFGSSSYPASAEVQQDSVIGAVKNSDMEKLIIANPGIALSMLHIMSKRLRSAQEKVRNLALNDVRRRIILALLEIAAEHGVQREEDIILKLTLTNQELASMVGTSREAANRIISELKKKGILEVNRRQIVIKDQKKLRALV